MIVVLSEASFVDRHSINGRELTAFAETARLFGCSVYPIPTNFDVCGSAENALAYVPTFSPPILGIWGGYIPSPDRYAAIYAAAKAKGIHLLNTPTQYQTAMEFDRFYPLIEPLTPKSMTIADLGEIGRVEAEIGYPVFVKGAIKSNKEQGWDACVAKDSAELITISQGLLARDSRSRGRIIIRELVTLRRVDAEEDFPIGREYRLFIYKDEILAGSFYWDMREDPFPPSDEDTIAINRLALTAANLVGTPYISVDIGQTENGDWIVIEVGDAQFSGFSNIPMLEIWGKLSKLKLEI